MKGGCGLEKKEMEFPGKKIIEQKTRELQLGHGGPTKKLDIRRKGKRKVSRYLTKRLSLPHPNPNVLLSELSILPPIPAI